MTRPYYFALIHPPSMWRGYRTSLTVVLRMETHIFFTGLPTNSNSKLTKTLHGRTFVRKLSKPSRTHSFPHHSPPKYKIPQPNLPRIPLPSTSSKRQQTFSRKADIFKKCVSSPPSSSSPPWWPQPTRTAPGASGASSRRVWVQIL